MNHETTDCQAGCLSRRLFLGASGTVTAMLLGDVFPGRVLGQQTDEAVEVTALPRKKIAALSELKIGEAVKFSYPEDNELHNCMLVRTGEESGGGIGEQQDVVAFSARCTHMGRSLDGTYNGQHKVAGPCPLHLTTFDLTRHGMVVAGHATQALPQVILELDGDDIYATGLIGLLYGHSTNG